MCWEISIYCISYLLSRKKKREELIYKLLIHFFALQKNISTCLKQRFREFGRAKTVESENGEVKVKVGVKRVSKQLPSASLKKIKKETVSVSGEDMETLRRHNK